MSDEKSVELFERAQRVMPGGVNSPVRAFRAVRGTPVFIREGHGATVFGADGTPYIDYVGSWGPLILGHAHPAVVDAVCSRAKKGLSFGAPTELETDLAERLCEAVPSMQSVRLTSSGTEAVMGALRLARGHTGRDVVVKFEGGYHGSSDSLLVKAGSGAATFGTPDSAGVPAAVAATTAVVAYNELAPLERLFAERGADIAAVIVEPVAGNMGCVPPVAGWLEGLRDLTRAAGSLLIFDEVMTGFRVAYGGAQARFGIRPDLTCLGKIVGGGLPVGAYGGPAAIMEKVAPEGPVYQGGTLSGNPLSVAAGLATLEVLRQPGVYERLESVGAEVEVMLVEAARAAGVPCCVQRVGSMVTAFFTDEPVRSFADASRSDSNRFARWHRLLLQSGVYWPPSQFEAAFVSLAHDEAALERTRAAVTKAFAGLP